MERCAARFQTVKFDGYDKRNEICPYLDRSLHDDVGGIIHSLRAQLQHSRVALLFGLVDVVIDFLKTSK